MSVAVPRLASRSDLIVERIREECERARLDEEGLRSVVITVKMDQRSGGIRTVIVSREMEVR